LAVRNSGSRHSNPAKLAHSRQKIGAEIKLIEFYEYLASQTIENAE
jgi:hypothetical protein